MMKSQVHAVTFWGFAFLWAVCCVQAHPVKKRSARLVSGGDLETQLQRVKRLDGESFQELSRVKRGEEVELTRVKRGEEVELTRVKRGKTLNDESQFSRQKRDELELARVKRDELELARVKRDELELSRVKRDELELSRVKRDELELSRVKRDELELSRVKRDELELSRMKRKEVELSREKRRNLNDEPQLSREKRINGDDHQSMSRTKRDSVQGNSLDVRNGMKRSEAKVDLAEKANANSAKLVKKAEPDTKQKKNKRMPKSGRGIEKRKMGWWEKRARKRFFHHETNTKRDGASNKRKRNKTKSRRFHKASHELVRNDKEVDDVKNSSKRLAMKKRNFVKNH